MAQPAAKSRSTDGDRVAGPRARSRAAVAVLAALVALVLAVPAGALAATDVQVSPSSATPDPAAPHGAQQPRVAADPTNAQRFVASYQKSAKDGSIDSCYVATSTNAGQSWSQQSLVGPQNPAATFRFNLPTGFGECLDPQVSVGPNGTIYYLYEPRQLAGLGERRVMLTTSSDFGATWSTPHEVNAVGFERTDLWSSMAVDPRSGRVYVAWLRYCEPPTNLSGLPTNDPTACAPNPLRVLVAYSDDAGKTFSAPVSVDAVSRDPSRTSLTVDRVNGRVSVAWSEGAGSTTAVAPPNADLLVASSTDGAKSFSPARPVALVDGNSTECDRLRWTQHSSSHGFFHLLAGKSADQLYVARWDIDPTAPGQRCRVFFQRSADGGATWTQPKVVGDAGRPATNQQHRPRLALSPDGNKLYMLYYDTDTAAHRQDVYEVTSPDGGDTWTSPVKVSDTSSDTTIGPDDRPTATHERSFGEWLGVDASSAGLVGAWTDSRLGNPSTNLEQDVFSDTLGL
jgi:hypothetical protein